MAKRFKMSKKGSRRQFTKKSRVNRKNVPPAIMRGGIRA